MNVAFFENAKSSGSGYLDFNSSWTLPTGDADWHLAALLGLDFVGRSSVGALAANIILNYITVH